MNHFESKGGTQNIAQGDGAIGQQNTSNCVSQAVIGNGNVFSGSGDVRIEHLHHHYPRTEQGIPLQRPPLAEHFKGRDEVLRDLLPLLQPGKVIAICGPGGMGKTALAAQAAWTLAPGKEASAHFPDGIIFYSFYGKHTAEEALAHIVRSYDEQQQDTSPDAARRLLASKQALLILDGTEEAKDLPAMLKLYGSCGVLITSRKHEDAPDELLELKKLEKQPAEEVFRLHSKAAADDPSVPGICAILDGWPVALRIAGRYLRSTKESAADYLKWLEKEPFKELGDGQHQQENAALLLRRSVAQVSDDARLALGLAGTLAFASIAREPVAAILDGDERRARKALGELVNYGLLDKAGERWQISHALIHTYAREELPLSKESLERLAGWYIAFCKAASAEHAKGYARLDAERAHCLRLMESCLNRGLIGELSHLVGEMDIYLDLQGYWIDYQVAFNMMLTGSRQAGHHHNQGWCLNQLGLICRKSGEYKKALAYFEQCLPIQRKLREWKEQGDILNNIGWTYDAQGNYEQALRYYKQSLKIRRKFKDRSGEGITLNNIAMVYNVQGNYETALKYLKQDIAICRNANDKVGEATTLNNFGVIYYIQNNFAKALQYWEQALAIAHEFGNRVGEAQTCVNIAGIYATQGNLAKVEKYMSQAVQIYEKIDSPYVERYRRWLAWVRAARQG